MGLVVMAWPAPDQRRKSQKLNFCAFNLQYGVTQSRISKQGNRAQSGKSWARLWASSELREPPTCLFALSVSCSFDIVWQMSPVANYLRLANCK
jgi:hypothetical protein